MSIPESVIEAAEVVCSIQDDTEPRARRVILALAENIPEHAVDKAWQTYCDRLDTFHCINKGDVRAAIAAFLKHVAGETP
jgi:hypothetical protein